MQHADPVPELDPRFSSSDAAVTEWSEARRELEEAEVFWLSTVRPGGGPQVTPLIALWLEEALYFCTGPTERKAKNLEHNTNCVVTTGSNALNEGLDLMLEGRAERVTDDDQLRRIADGYESKYGPDWHFDVRDGAFQGDGGEALVFGIAPTTGFGFRKGAYGQTRWRFRR